MTYRSIVHGASLFAALACTGCDIDLRLGARWATSGKPTPVHVEIVTAEQSKPTLLFSAVVEPTSSRLLTFQYAGRIARIRVAAGECVAAGDIVAEFDLADLERRVAAARASVDRAEQHVARGVARSLRRRHLLELVSDPGSRFAPNEIEGVLREAEARYARVGLATAEAQLAAGVLRAPAAGVIDRHYREVGAFASPGEPIVRLSEFYTVVLRAVVPRAVLTLVREGGRAEVRSGDGNRVGSIRRVGGPGEIANEGVPFEVWVANPDLALRPGDVLELAVAVEPREVTSSISLAALRRGIGADPFSFVVVGEGDGLHVERRSVTLGGLRGDRVLVIAGLAIGERVVSLGNELVTVGDRVTIIGEGR